MLDEDFERQKILIEGENVNISEKNVLKDFAQVLINIVLWLFCIYISAFFISGIAIKSLSIEKQIALENFMSKIAIEDEMISINEKEIKKLNYLKNEILSYDKKFPKISNLEIKIIHNSKPNALCLPNGNIYITSSLYNKIKSQDEELFFVIAHEMAHYKNKDHIMNLRKGIASSVVLLVVALGGNDSNNLSGIINEAIDFSDLNYSRGVEKRADNYAGAMLMRKYQTTQGGIRTLELLTDKKYPEIFGIFSTHPTIETRIKNLKRIEKKI